MGEERGNREDRDREDVCVHVCVSFSLSVGRSLTVVLLPTANEHVFASTASVEAVLYALRTHIKLADVVESYLYTINSLARNGANRQLHNDAATQLRNDASTQVHKHHG